MEPRDVTLLDQVACVDRELGFRLKVYPRWVAARPKPKMTAEAMNREISRMRAVRSTLVRSAALDEVVAQLQRRLGLPMGELVGMIEKEERLFEAQFPRAP